MKNSQTHFFHIDQNNSGGSFTVNDKLCHRLFIEAADSREANRIARDLGCYWNGCDEGMDCECCGDRWYPASNSVDITKGWEASILHSDNKKPLQESVDAWNKKYSSYDLEIEPKWENASVKGWKQYKGRIKFKSVEQYAQFIVNEYTAWTKPDARIFYKNGEVTELNKQK